MGTPGAPQVTGPERSEQRWRSHLEGIQARDAESLTLLYDETAHILYGLAFRVLNDPADAEEVILDVFHQVWTWGDRYDASRGSVWTWLTTITRNRAIDRLRQANLRRARELPFELRADSPSERPAPEIESIFAQERDLVRRAMNTLAPEQRHAIELAFFSGLTHIEIAETLGVPLGTIKTRIRVGIQKLRAALPASVGTGKG